jgi:hypothetical protein
MWPLDYRFGRAAISNDYAGGCGFGRDVGFSEKVSAPAVCTWSRGGISRGGHTDRSCKVPVVYRPAFRTVRRAQGYRIFHVSHAGSGPFIPDLAVGGILRSLRMPYFCCSKLISLQPIDSPFGFRQYRPWPLHFAKSSYEIRQSRSLRIPPTAVFRFMAPGARRKKCSEARPSCPEGHVPVAPNR